jgi:hypothetical protein
MKSFYEDEIITWDRLQYTKKNELINQNKVPFLITFLLGLLYRSQILSFQYLSLKVNLIS